jgi:hypothetical protein
VEVRLEEQSVGPKIDIRILDIQLDSALRRQTYIYIVEAKAVYIINTLYIIIRLI